MLPAQKRSKNFANFAINNITVFQFPPQIPWSSLFFYAHRSASSHKEQKNIFAVFDVAAREQKIKPHFEKTSPSTSYSELIAAGLSDRKSCPFICFLEWRRILTRSVIVGVRNDVHSWRRLGRKDFRKCAFELRLESAKAGSANGYGKYKRTFTSKFTQFSNEVTNE